MAKKKRRKKQEDGVDESWLLPYSDLLTLLLALFIVLFASSSLDEAKMDQMATVFNEMFDSGIGIMEHDAPVPSPADNKAKDGDGEGMDRSSYLEDQRSLSEAQAKMDDFIAANELEDLFETQMTDEGLLVTIRDNVLFDMGESQVSQEHMDLAREISDLLVFDRARQIIITGHTDNVPIQTAEYSSNWELSVMRAVNFLKIIVENEELDPINFSAKGYGEYRPIASNDTPEGRSKNRRVEVLIQPLVLKDGTKVNAKP